MTSYIYHAHHCTINQSSLLHLKNWAATLWQILYSVPELHIFNTEMYSFI
jgi:hypothetical protein